MKAFRKSFGQEAVEVAIVSIIILGLAVGAVVLFGEKLRLIFQSEDSPIIVSATKMDNSTNASSPDGVGSRTNVDTTLVTDQLITKSYSDSSIGSAVGQETTGATGGDAAIGGTYEVTNALALADGDPSTTGNALLDAALAAKNSALALINSATATETLASLYVDKANGLLTQVAEGQGFLDSLGEGLDQYLNQVDLISNHLDMLLNQQFAAATLATSSFLGIDYGEMVNIDILSQTDMNLTMGLSLASLYSNQNTEQDEYNTMKAAYDAGWVETCDAEGNCTSTNTSGITLEDLNAQLALVNTMLMDAEGQKAALEDAIDELEETIDDLHDQVHDAFDDADKLREDSKKTIKEAFKWGTFDGCWTLDQFIARAEAEIAVGDTNWKIKNFEAAKSALELLKKSRDAYDSAYDLKAEMDLKQVALEQQRDILDALNSGSSVSLTASAQSLQDLIDQQEAALESAKGLSAEIQLTIEELIHMEGLVVGATDAVNAQQAYLNTLQAKALEAQLDAQETLEQSNTLLNDANNALTEAQNTIDTIVCTPEEEPCS